MDGTVGTADILHREATPPEAPLAMPTQSLRCAPVVAFPTAEVRVRSARIIAFIGAAALTFYGFDQMRQVFGNETETLLQGVLLAFFTLTFGWIAFSATQALAGLFCAPKRPRPAAEGPLASRTAILMPVYHEDPAATGAALLAVGEALAEAGHGRAFEIFILSDSREPTSWARELAAFSLLRDRLAGRMAVWYRRRPLNRGRKAGNLRDFVERWGGRYDHMLVLDADSLMAAETVVEMVRRMEAAPALGILQTVPVLAGGDSFFARLQQFAGRLYGPVIARGVAAWQGLDGNYWGHNALIRTRAFAENCGLPELKGPLPFGGHVMSHDFVEAALIRRGGWEVRMDPDLEGSWEGGPPSLLDLAARDRRWAQGNLQHLGLLGTKRLRLPNRVHFMIGIGAYLMSPMWLAMLFVGVLLTAQALLVQPQYFPDALQLFPNWPVFDAERMGRLFWLAMGILLLPKALGLLRALASPRRCQAFGGPLALLFGSAFEVLLSALYAPMLMLMQAAQVAEILLGRDSGWSTQVRAGRAMAWRRALARHWHHFLAGLVPAVALYWLAPDNLIWLSPVLAGLVLAPLLSGCSGSARLGRLAAALGLLSIPEERQPPELFRRAGDYRADFAAVARLQIGDLAREAGALRRHLGVLGETVPADEAGQLARITAGAKIAAAASPEQALGWLAPAEREALLGSPALLQRWAASAALDDEEKPRPAAGAGRNR